MMPFPLMCPDYFPTAVLSPLTDKHSTCVEQITTQPMTNLIELDNPCALRPDEMVLLQVTEGSARQTVVRRDDDMFTFSQIKEKWVEGRNAMLKELQTWGKLNVSAADHDRAPATPSMSDG